jgi:hypothetical protein
MSLTEAELSAIENRAHHLPDERLREDVLRLIAEVRQARAASAFAAVGDPGPKPAQPLQPAPPTLDADHIPPGGRVRMGEWLEIAARLRTQRSTLPEARPSSEQEAEEHRHRWETVRAQLGWDAQEPLTPEQEAEIERLIRNEIQAHQQERRERERHANGR